ncbi:MAG: YbaB/EbfC family nucleoid-associated protein [Deltaproteobacteria bacterium]|jgi:DNA-binding YbaB/EbfC family protein|nr:YbaB/EbfC family nucleoid-associated protein [Deltaproteobacteria bacterium]
MDINGQNADNIIRKVQQLQSGMLKLLGESGDRTVSATSGGGMVKATANWKLQLVSVELEREVVNPDDVEMLSDLIVAAVNEALSQAQAEVNQEMIRLSSKLRFPDFAEQG